MAFSSTEIHNMPLGNKKVKYYDVNFASVTEGVVKTGLQTVEYASFNNSTGTRAGQKTEKNVGASGAERGSVKISAVTSDDVGELMVIGR